MESFVAAGARPSQSPTFLRSPPPASLPAGGPGGGGSQAVDAAALALQDVLTTSLYAVVGTFGEGLRKVVAEAKGAPPVGATKADAAALLERLLRAEE